MVESVYEWLKNIVFYLMIATAVLEVLPGNSYRKYIRFFTGMVLIMLFLEPVLGLTGVKDIFSEFYHDYTYEQERREAEKQQEYLKNLDILEFLPEEYVLEWNTEDAEKGRTDEIEVEEIRIEEVE